MRNLSVKNVANRSLSIFSQQFIRSSNTSVYDKENQRRGSGAIEQEGRDRGKVRVRGQEVKRKSMAKVA